MSATSIVFASWFIRNKLDIDLSPDTIDSIISRLQSSWDDFSSIHTTTELPLAPVLLPKPRATKINNILQSHVATNTYTDEQSYNIHPVITLAPLTDNLDVHDDAKANKKPTKPRAKQIIPNLVHAQSDGGDVVPKKQTKPRAKKNAILAIDSLDNDIHPVSVKRTKKQPHAPFDENEIHQKHNQPHVINTFEPTDNHNNTIIISSLHDNNSIDNSNELLEEETQLTEVFVNDVLFYFDQTHNSWFDYSLSPISDPTI